MRHLTSCSNLSVSEAEQIVSTAFSIKKSLLSGKKKMSVLKGICVVNLFFEPSTRTRTSFEKAGKYLSADVINVSTSYSSVKKGETLIDTVRNLSMMHPDIIVLRHPHEGACELIKPFTDASVINAGDGCHEHPTQALLDLMTVMEYAGDVKDLNIVIMGDVGKSRVARSDAILFGKFGAQVYVFGPPSMTPRFPEALGVKVLNSFDEVVEKADVLIALRVQFERQNFKKTFPSTREYSKLFGLTPKRISMLKKDTLIMHPGPFNRGVELTGDILDDERTVIFQQVENGLAVRMALLTILAGREKNLKEALNA